MKSLAHKLLVFTFVIALATGCASVTDAGMASQPDQPTVEQPQPNGPEFDTDAQMGTIVDRPE